MDISDTSFHGSLSYLFMILELVIRYHLQHLKMFCDNSACRLFNYNICGSMM